MNSKSLAIRISVIALTVALIGIAVVYASNHAGLATFHTNLIPVQNDPNAPDIELLPTTLERLSWGGVIAGSLITLLLTFILNLIGVAIGLTQVNPEHPHDSADAEGLVTGGVIWIAVSNLVALLIGGGLAAYFAGIPEPVDGVLHGIMVWAVTGIITIIFVMSGVGRALSGLAGLISTGMSLTGTLASGAGQLAGGALQTAGSAVGTAGNLTAQTLSVLAHGVQSSAQVVGNSMSHLSDAAIDNSPEVQNALKYQDLTLDEIRLKAERLMREAGKNPERAKQQVEAAVDDVKNAAQQAIRHPENADQFLNLALQRVFRRGEDLASDIDRDALVNLLMEETDITREEAQQQVQEWEQQFHSVKEQTRQARETAIQRAEEFRQQAEQKAHEIYEDAQNRAAEMQQEVEARLHEAAHEAETKAREAAQAASDTFAKVAAGIAISMLVGALAAGVGGYIGTPANLPDLPAESVRYTPVHEVLSNSQLILAHLPE